ncbi:BnaA01g06070D [Brassica napus]|uniref:BnaA01g06070D protein n=2 Tax=Brassica TaxID=3705 RepID=A0A078GSW0_BRANA|nr:BnaA01g06070D [Brassica napus]VDC74160.1 unnamed protein product [Brassica rapa]
MLHRGVVPTPIASAYCRAQSLGEKRMILPLERTCHYNELYYRSTLPILLADPLFCCFKLLSNLMWRNPDPIPFWNWK